MCVVLDLDSYDGSWTHIERFRNRSGWIVVAAAQLEDSERRWNTTLAAGCDEYGAAIPGFMVPNLLACHASTPEPCYEFPPDELDDALREEEGALIGRWTRESNQALANLVADAEYKIAILEAQAKAFVTTADKQIADLKRRRRMLGQTSKTQVILTEIIAEIEREQDLRQSELVQERASIRESAMVAEEKAIAEMDIHLRIEPLYVLHWTAGCNVDQEAQSFWKEYNGPFNLETRRRNDPDELQRIKVELDKLQIGAKPKPAVEQPSGTIWSDEDLREFKRLNALPIWARN